jgi:hypothetical protein
MHSQLNVVGEGGLRIVEGTAGHELMQTVADTDRVIEACLSESINLVLLYADNLTHAFFDLSSGEAGAILQKLRNYRIRLAVLCAPRTARFSSRFGEMEAEERRGPYFGVFETRGEAREWLGLPIGRRNEANG